MDNNKHFMIANAEKRGASFSKHEPVWGAPGVTPWMILRYRLVKAFFIDLITPAVPFVIFTSIGFFRWLELLKDNKVSVIVSSEMIFLYLIAWLFHVRRQEAGMLLEALASMIKGISIKWGGPPMIIPGPFPGLPPGAPQDNNTIGDPDREPPPPVGLGK